MCAECSIQCAHFRIISLAPSVDAGVGPFARSSKYLQHPIFNSHHNEHSMLRWVDVLQREDGRIGG